MSIAMNPQSENLFSSLFHSLKNVAHVIGPAQFNLTFGRLRIGISVSIVPTIPVINVPVGLDGKPVLTVVRP